MKHSEEGKWTVSIHNEIFNSGLFFDTKEQAIEGGKKEFTWKGFCPPLYVGQVKSVDFALGVNLDFILEQIAENVYEEVGEVSEGYLNHVEKEHSEQLEKDINNLVLKWMEKYNYAPEFFKVINIEKITSRLEGE